MLSGRYRGTDARPGRPYVRVKIELPDLGRSGEVTLLIDTGADVSMIGPDDARRLKFDEVLKVGSPGVEVSQTEVAGIGGTLCPFLVRARLSFLSIDSGTCLGVKDFDALDIVTRDLTVSRFSSVLGWDLLADLEEFGFSWPRREIFSVKKQ